MIKIKIMIRKILFLLVIFSFLPLSASDPVADSLKQILEEADKQSKASILNSLAEHYLNLDNEKSLEYSQKALMFCDQSDIELIIDISITIASAYEFSRNYPQAIEYYKQNLERIPEGKFEIKKAYIHFSLGLIYDQISEYDKALSNYQLAACLYNKLNVKVSYGNILNNIGITYETLTVYDTALEYYLKSLEVYRQIEDKEGIAHTYNNIGNIYQTMNNFTKAREYYLRSMDIYKELEDKSGISSSLNNIGILYDEMKEYDKALDYYNQSLELAREIDEESGVSTALNNIGIIYHNRKNYEQAEEYYLISLESSKVIGDQWGIVNTYSNLGELYIDWQYYEKGINYLNQAFDLAKIYNFRDLIMECHKIFTKYYVSQDNYKLAYQQMNRFYEVKDSLFLDSSRKIADIQTIYETEKKEKEIELLVLGKKHQRTVKFFFLFSTVLFFVVAIWLYRLYYLKNHEIHTRKKLEKKIIGLASVLNQANESVVITDTKGNIVYFNPCYEKKTGRNLKNLIGSRPLFWDYIKAGDEKNVWDTVREDEKWHGTLQDLDQSGNMIYETVDVFPVKDDEDDTINYAAIKHDITEIILKENELEMSEKKFRRMAENISDGLVIIENGNVAFVNDRMEDITGYSKAELKGLTSVALAAPFEKERVRDFAELSKKYPDQLDYFEYWIKRKDGELRYIHNGYSLYKEDGKIVNRYMVISDITDRKKYEQKIENSLKEKEILLQEINHRVKNNMQIISSLLKIQAGYVKDENLLKLFRNSQNRVKSMSLIHEKLYQSADLSRIAFEDYVDSLTRHLYTTYGVSTERIQLLININEIKLGVDKAIPCGLIINELVSNSLKYAFPEGKTGTIKIELVKKEELYTLKIIDDGKGLPKDFELEKSTTLGMQLIKSLTDQLHGKITRLDVTGVGYKIEFS